jgi:tetratricopeptide (TPR) repeat protein
MSKGRATTRSSDSASAPPRVSEILATLPALPELGAFVDLLITRSTPDPERRWSGSGELGTVGDRLAAPAGLDEASASLAAREGARLGLLFANAARIVDAVSRSRWDEVLETLIEQGLAEEARGSAREAEAWFLAAHRLGRNRGLFKAPTALRLAARASRQQGDLELAAERYEAAFRDADALAQDADATVAAIGRGNVDVDRGNWRDAKTWYLKALARIGEGGPPRRERWQVMQNLAIVERECGNLAEARAALTRAQKEGDEMADPDARVDVENGWGQLLAVEGDARGAELHFRAALERARTPVARLVVTVNLGEALLLQGRSLEAGELARAAEAEALTGSLTHRLPEVYRLLAKVAHQRGEGEAFVLLERALQLIDERRLPDYEEAVTREALGELRLEQGERELGFGELAAAAEIYGRVGAKEAAGRVRERIRAERPANHPGEGA